MAYDEGLAERVRAQLEDHPGFTEKKMFGGIGFMIGGNMAAGVMKAGQMMVRCALDETLTYCEEPGCDPMMRGGKPMRGWLLIAADFVADDDELAKWAQRGLQHAAGLPPK
jgi:TfoX/Sxy family transcriptional regulator of competence genes